MYRYDDYDNALVKARVAQFADQTRRERGGLLRHGSLLTVTSYATRTSPVIRGKWILDNLLGTPPPPPPPDVPALDETIATLLPVSPTLIHQPAREGDIRVSLGDARLATAQLPWSARTSLATGLTDLLDERWILLPSSPLSPSACTVRPI